jgi:predicted transcriptional regulator
MSHAVKIGITSYANIKARTIAIAKGEYKPRSGEPKVWLTSFRSLANTLSEENQELLKLIQKRQPESIAQLAEMTGRKTSNLSRTLKSLERCGIVELKESRIKTQRGGRAPVKPVVLAGRYDFEFVL